MWASGRTDEYGPEGPEGVESRRRAAENNRKGDGKAAEKDKNLPKRRKGGGWRRQFPNDACPYSSYSHHSLYSYHSCESHAGYNSHDNYGSHKGAARATQTLGSECPLILR